jgi:hypothetical protein
LEKLILVDEKEHDVSLSLEDEDFYIMSAFGQIVNNSMAGG